MNNNLIIYAYIAAGLVGIIVLVLILKKVGLIKNKEERVAKKIADAAPTTLQNIKFVNKTYFLGKKNLKNEADIKKLSLDMRKSMRWAGTNENKFFTTLAALDNKQQFSQLVDAYFRYEDRDLVDDILAEFNKKDLVRIITKLNTLE